ncbi:MAG: protein-export chaperone SecB [Burkholderiales bacterium]|nr:protein-export chaperone SecB [Sulfuricellaceae bacterium]
MSEEQSNPPSEEHGEPIFSIEKIYVKDLSLEVPHAPQIFMEQNSPQVDVQMHNRSRQIGEDNLYQSEVSVTVTAKLEDKTMFLVEVVQAGIFRIANVPQEHLNPVLGITCPNILFPYAREVVSDAINRAGFPPLLLSPVNFEALYQQQIAPAETATAH